MKLHVLFFFFHLATIFTWPCGYVRRTLRERIRSDARESNPLEERAPLHHLHGTQPLLGDLVLELTVTVQGVAEALRSVVEPVAADESGTRYGPKDTERAPHQLDRRQQIFRGTRRQAELVVHDGGGDDGLAVVEEEIQARAVRRLHAGDADFRKGGAIDEPSARIAPAPRTWRDNGVVVGSEPSDTPLMNSSMPAPVPTIAT